MLRSDRLMNIKKEMCKCIAVALVFALLPFSWIPSVKADGLGVYLGSAVEGQGIGVSWDSVPNAEHYEYTILDETTGEYYASHDVTTSTSTSIPGSFVQANHRYKVWVGAFYAVAEDNMPEGIGTTIAECAKKRKSEHFGTTYKPYDETYHTVTDVYKVTCKLCGSFIEYENDEYEEEHTFKNGSCTQCGQTEKLEKLSVTVSRDQSSAETGEYIGATADVSGGSGSYRFAWEVTRDGSTVRSTSEANAEYGMIASQPGSYRFQVTVEDKQTGEKASATSGAIAVSQAQCTHEDQIETLINTEYIQSTDEEHTVRRTYQISCDNPVCGEILNTHYDETQEPHTMGSDGICTLCGYAAPTKTCEHEQTRAEKIGEELRQCNSDNEHYYVEFYQDVCANPECGIVVNPKREVISLVAHQFVDGKCACGFVEPTPPCDHATTGVPEGDPVYQIVDANYHSVTTYERHRCACGAVDELREKTVQMTHRFENGVCVCGMQEPATEAPVTEPPVTQAPVTQPPAETMAPVTQPPTEEPEEPPTAKPVETEAPVTQPPAETQAPVTQPPAETLPPTEKPVEQPTAKPTATALPATQPPMEEPPTAKPVETEAPVTQAPVTQPPAETLPPTEKPVEQPTAKPTATALPATQPPMEEPPTAKPAATEPPVTQTPVTQPPAMTQAPTEKPTEQPTAKPTATAVPATQPPTEEPPTAKPAATEPPVTQPPAEGACQHPSTDTMWMTTGGYTITYQSVSDTEHTMNGYMYNYCTVCGKMVGEPYPVSITQRHEANGGSVCSLCGCTNVHVHTWEDKWQGNPTYTNLNADRHRVSGMRYQECTSCGEKTAAAYAEVVVAHDFSSKGHIEAAHSDPAKGHLLFDRCACGAAHYTGYSKYENCCECYGHQWGKAYEENGEWYQKCTRCGEKKKADYSPLPSAMPNDDDMIEDDSEDDLFYEYEGFQDALNAVKNFSGFLSGEREESGIKIPSMDTLTDDWLANSYNAVTGDVLDVAGLNTTKAFYVANQLIDRYAAETALDQTLVNLGDFKSMLKGIGLGFESVDKFIDWLAKSDLAENIVYQKGDAPVNFIATKEELKQLVFSNDEDIYMYYDPDTFEKVVEQGFENGELGLSGLKDAIKWMDDVGKGIGYAKIITNFINDTIKYASFNDKMKQDFANALAQSDDEVCKEVAFLFRSMDTMTGCAVLAAFNNGIEFAANEVTGAIKSAAMTALKSASPEFYYAIKGSTEFNKLAFGIDKTYSAAYKAQWLMETTKAFETVLDEKIPQMRPEDAFQEVCTMCALYADLVSLSSDGYANVITTGEKALINRLFNWLGSDDGTKAVEVLEFMSVSRCFEASLAINSLYSVCEESGIKVEMPEWIPEWVQTINDRKDDLDNSFNKNGGGGGTSW